MIVGCLRRSRVEALELRTYDTKRPKNDTAEIVLPLTPEVFSLAVQHDKREAKRGKIHFCVDEIFTGVTQGNKVSSSFRLRSVRSC